MKAVQTKLWAAAVVLLLGTASLFAQDLASIEKRTTVKKLDNGLTVVILERHEAPVFSYATFVDTGSAQDPAGRSGLAHMFEHMAFKGTNAIGTTNYAAESASLDKVEAAYETYSAARRATPQDAAKLADAEKGWKASVDDANKYVVQNEFSKIIERSGGTNLNAGTAEDFTVYFYSIPSNRLELWAYLESERYLHPAYREFYKERDVVTEERRLRTENSPFGRLIEKFDSTAYTTSPYRITGVGTQDDLKTFSANDARAFFKKYYVPANMVVAIVGDVNPAEAMPIVEKYLGRLPKAPKPDTSVAAEPAQTAERSFVLSEQTQPLYIEGYHRPPETDRDDPVYSVIDDLLSTGRTSRLYRSVVRDKKLAAQIIGLNGWPGTKFTNEFAIIGVPTPGHAAADLSLPIRAELDRLKSEDVGADELQSVKTRQKASLLRKLDDNSGLAIELAQAQTRYGDWREVFRSADRIDKVTAADIRRVAAATFVETNRTVGRIEKAAPASAPAAAAPKGETK